MLLNYDIVLYIANKKQAKGKIVDKITCLCDSKPKNKVEALNEKCSETAIQIN